MRVNPNHIPYGNADQYADFLAGIRANVEEEADDMYEASVVRREGWALVSSLLERLNNAVTLYGPVGSEVLGEPHRHEPVEVEPGPWRYLPGVHVPLPPQVDDAQR